MTGAGVAAAGGQRRAARVAQGTHAAAGGRGARRRLTIRILSRPLGLLRGILGCIWRLLPAASAT